MPDDKIVQDAYLLTEEPEPEWGLAHSTPVQGGIWGPPKSDKRGKVGKGADTYPLPPFPAGGP